MSQKRKKTRYFGCHVSCAGGLIKALHNAEHLGVNTIQIHASPPQQWNRKPFAPGVETEFLRAKPTSCVKKIFIHAIYLINLASIDDEKYELSKSSLKYTLDLSARIGSDGVIVHVGSLRDHEAGSQAGYERAAEAINEILEETPDDARLLLEVAAGGGKVIGSRIEELKLIFDQVDQKPRVGFVLDTQHLWASGYDLRDNLEQVAKDIRSCFGLRKIRAIHVNDSMTDLASRRDRHANIGEGTIGAAALAAFLNHPNFATIPCVLETPGLKQLDTAAREVEALAQLLGKL